MTFKTTHLARTTFAAALLSAAVLMQPAQAGLLGGGGALGGGLGGGLGGQFGPSSLDARGSAAAQVQHDVALRRAQAAQAQAAQTGQAQAARSTDTATAAHNQAAGAASRGASVELQKSLTLESRKEGVDAGGAAAAQATRGSRSVGASGAAQASVQR